MRPVTHSCLSGEPHPNAPSHTRGGKECLTTQAPVWQLERAMGTTLHIVRCKLRPYAPLMHDCPTSKQITAAIVMQAGANPCWHTLVESAREAEKHNEFHRRHTAEFR